MKRFSLILLFIILVLGFAVRLYRFSGPIADWQSWRQADTSSVSRNFVTHGFHLLTPTYQDISNVPSGLDNPHGYRFVEFPIYNTAQAGFFVLFNHFTLEEWGRLVTIFASLSTSLVLYLLVKRHVDETAGLFAAFFFTFIPFNIYYGRSILPDVSMAAAVLAGIYFFDLWTTEKRDGMKICLFLLSLVFTAVSLLLKPFAIFFMLPFLVLAYNAFGWNFFRKYQLSVFAFFALIPLIVWRIWIMQHPEGIASSTWLFNGGNVRFHPSYFYWVYGERIAKLILGYFGIFLLFRGVLHGFIEKKTQKRLYPYLFFSLLFGSFLYLSVIARGNLQHDYYQILIMPTLSLFMGLGARSLWFYGKNLRNQITARILLAIAILFTLSFGWFYVRDYFNINNRAIVHAGEAVDQNTPKDAKVIALYGGDTSFLYQTKRQGWASFEKPLPEMIHMGAAYMAIVNPTPNDINGFGKTYTVVASSPEYLVLKLK